MAKSKPITKDEITRIEAYLKKTFGTRNLSARARPKITDSCEIYIGDEFIATVSIDEEEGEGGRDFTLQMSILEIDLEGG